MAEHKKAIAEYKKAIAEYKKATKNWKQIKDFPEDIQQLLKSGVAMICNQCHGQGCERCHNLGWHPTK